MIHEHCRTYFNVAPRRCEHCGLLWCPRCRRWFAPTDQSPTPRAAGTETTDDR